MKTSKKRKANKSDPIKKKMCLHCASWSGWREICANKKSKRFKVDTPPHTRACYHFANKELMRNVADILTVSYFSV